MFLKIYILAVSAYPYFLKITVSPYRRTRTRIGVSVILRVSVVVAYICNADANAGLIW